MSPQEAQTTATHPLIHKEQAPEPQSLAWLGRQQQNPKTCKCTHCHHHDSDHYHQGQNHLCLRDKPLIWIPNPEETWVTLTPIGAVNLIIFKNELTGNTEYETQILESLLPNLADSGPKIRAVIWVSKLLKTGSRCNAKWEPCGSRQRLNNENIYTFLIRNY